jgi:hypothetical protein
MTVGPSFHRRRETTSKKTRPSSPSNSRTAASTGETRSTKPPTKRAQLHYQSWDWLGTFWAHSVSTVVNCGESQRMSFRSSVPVRLRDQHPEMGSIPGSSTTSTPNGRYSNRRWLELDFQVGDQPSPICGAEALRHAAGDARTTSADTCCFARGGGNQSALAVVGAPAPSARTILRCGLTLPPPRGQDFRPCVPTGGAEPRVRVTRKPSNAFSMLPVQPSMNAAPIFA